MGDAYGCGIVEKLSRKELANQAQDVENQNKEMLDNNFTNPENEETVF
jgi:hypothetical protein